MRCWVILVFFEKTIEPAGYGLNPSHLGPRVPNGVPALIFVLTVIVLPFRFVSNCFVSNSDWGYCRGDARKEARTERRKALYTRAFHDRRYSAR